MKIYYGLLIFASSYLIVASDEGRGVNGGMNCAVCSVVTGIIQQDAYLQGISIFNAANKLCKKLPMKIQQPCYKTVTALKPLFVDKRFLYAFTPDVFCYALDSCRVDPGESFCHLFPKPHLSPHLAIKHMKRILSDHRVYEILNGLFNGRKSSRNTYSFKETYQSLFEYNSTPIFESYSVTIPKVDFCELPVLKMICDVFLGTFGKLKPAVDLDGDGFSLLRTARGSDWRGKDCSDIDSDIYPGAQTRNLDSRIDSNCNGIWGEDPITRRPWEEILCDDTEAEGLIYLGDSIGAHFHFPEPWMNPNLPISTSLATIIETVLDEFDWPELGFATGFMNSTYPDLIQGTTDSIYLRLRENNLCSHRDYQNGARNGAMSKEGTEEVLAISRKPSDKPALLIFAMMGNDVCNRYRDSVGNMTTPAQFKKLVLDTLDLLDKKLPKKSKVVLVSLLDASFIYPTMSERIHPLGSVLNNIKYKNVYEWFSCMEIGPCEGWMTPNVTLQKLTTQRAKELSDVLKNIAAKSSYNSFKLYYLKNPFNTAIDKWVAKGGQIYELIDPIDSTHPSQKAQPLLATALWDSLKSIGVIGKSNPNNKKIKELFGDQGGH